MDKIWGLLLLIYSAKATHIEKTTTTHSTTEKINGKAFHSFYQANNGVYQEAWNIDDVPVLQEEFYKKRLEEIVKEETIAQEVAYHRQKEALTFQATCQKTLLKKIILSVIKDIEKLIMQIQEKSLQPYKIFSKDTIPSEIELNILMTTTLEQARHLATKPDKDFNYQEGELTLTLLEEYPKKLNKLFEETVKKAIQECNETEHLKKLLDLVNTL